MFRSRHALTLIELLVAMGIAVLLAAVVFAIYAGVLRTLDSQGRWRSAAYPAAAALDALTLDLTRAVIPWGITNAPFVLDSAPDAAGGIKLHFFAAMPSSGATRDAPQAPGQSRPGSDVRAYFIREMDYTLSLPDAAGINGAPRAPRGLIRAWRSFRADDSAGIASNQEVWAGIRAVRLEVFDGKLWTNTWDGVKNTNAPLPRAARVMFAVGDEPASRWACEVLIPAGQRIAAPKSRKQAEVRRQ